MDLAGTNKARINYYREQLSQLGLGLEDKMDESRACCRAAASGNGAAHVDDDPIEF